MDNRHQVDSDSSFVPGQSAGSLREKNILAKTCSYPTNIRISRQLILKKMTHLSSCFIVNLELNGVNTFKQPGRQVQYMCQTIVLGLSLVVEVAVLITALEPQYTLSNPGPHGGCPTDCGIRSKLAVEYPPCNPDH